MAPARPCRACSAAGSPRVPRAPAPEAAAQAAPPAGPASRVGSAVEPHRAGVALLARICAGCRRPQCAPLPSPPLSRAAPGCHRSSRPIRPGRRLRVLPVIPRDQRRKNFTVKTPALTSTKTTSLVTWAGRPASRDFEEFARVFEQPLGIF